MVQETTQLKMHLRNTGRLQVGDSIISPMDAGWEWRLIAALPEVSAWECLVAVTPMACLGGQPQLVAEARVVEGGDGWPNHVAVVVQVGNGRAVALSNRDGRFWVIEKRLVKRKTRAARLAQIHARLSQSEVF